MTSTMTPDFSSFHSRLSPVALSCFNELLDNACDLLRRNGPQKIYETPLAAMIEKCGAEDSEAIAQSIRDIIECRVQIKKGDFLYFCTFFSSVCIERGMIKYGLHQELQDVLP